MHKNVYVNPLKEKRKKRWKKADKYIYLQSANRYQYLEASVLKWNADQIVFVMFSSLKVAFSYW